MALREARSIEKVICQQRAVTPSYANACNDSAILDVAITIPAICRTESRDNRCDPKIREHLDFDTAALTLLHCKPHAAYLHRLPGNPAAGKEQGRREGVEINGLIELLTGIRPAERCGGRSATVSATAFVSLPRVVDVSRMHDARRNIISSSASSPSHNGRKDGGCHILSA